MSRVSVTINNHIATVTLSRADKMNAVDQEMVDGILAAGAEVNRPDVRAVVLHGDGRAFCAGLDVMSFAQNAASDPVARLVPRTHGDSNDMQAVAMIWHELPVPVIAALHGVAFGAGFQLALGADIRIAHPETQLSVMEMKWGLVPDMGGMVLLPRLARSDVIRRLMYTADPISAVQGEAWGLVTELSADPLDTAMSLAKGIVGKSPSAIRAGKRLLGLAETESDPSEILLAESKAQAALIGKPHQMEVIAANLQKRPAVFND